MVRVSKLYSYLPYTSHYDIVSFDLFDTLIYRQGLNASQILELSSDYLAMLLSQKSEKNFNAKEILDARRYWTKRIKMLKSAVNDEPSFDLVCYSLITELGFSDDVAKLAVNKQKEYELKLEMSSLKVNPGAHNLLAGLKDKNKTIIVVSDMYFLSKDIMRILKHLSLDQYIDKLYLSSDEGRKKSSGKLYETVLCDLNVEANNLIHLGDNRESDVIQANIKGVNAVLYSADKKTRFKRQQDELPVNISENVSNIVMAFVYEIALASHKHNWSCIYFLSRDATILGEVFKLAQKKSPIIKYLSNNVEIKQLCVSRASLMFLNTVGDTAYEKLYSSLNAYCDTDFSATNLDNFYNILDIPTSDRFCSELSIGSPRSNRQAIKTLIARAPELVTSMIHRVELSIDSAIAYLTQEKVFKATGVNCFVDIGYSGSIPRQIAKYAEVHKADFNDSNFNIEVKMLCSGNSFNDYVHNNYKGLVFRPSLFKENSMSAIQSLSFSWLEVFFQDSSRGPLLEYRFEDGKWSPVFNKKAHIVSANHSDWYEKFFCQIAHTCETDKLLMPSYRKNITRKFLSIMSKPNREAVKLVEGYAFERGVNGSYRSSIVDRSLSTSLLFNPYKLKSVVENDIWIEGSLVIMNKGLWLPFIRFTTSVFMFLKKYQKKLSLEKHFSINREN